MNHTLGRRATRAASAALAAVALLAVPAASGGFAAQAATCSTVWGSTAETAGALQTGRVDGIRSGRHSCYDRLVIDMTGVAPGYDVRYVGTVYADGSGLPVPVAGGARLAVMAKKGATSIPAVPAVKGYSTFRQVRWAGSFEGETTVALGVRARLPFRAFTINDAVTNRSRLVVDVAHHW